MSLQAVSSRFTSLGSVWEFLLLSLGKHSDSFNAEASRCWHRLQCADLSMGVADVMRAVVANNVCRLGVVAAVQQVLKLILRLRRHRVALRGVAHYRAMLGGYESADGKPYDCTGERGHGGTAPDDAWGWLAYILQPIM